jgi:hypothetical protein
VLVAAAAGLVLAWRAGRRAEAALCMAVAFAFLVLNSGYGSDHEFYGGDSPGPRFVIPALPFLAIGLGLAFARWRAATAVLAALSVICSTVVLLTWPAAVNTGGNYRWGVWREIGLFVRDGSSSQLARWLQKTPLDWLGVGLLGGAAFVLAAALGALAVSLLGPGEPDPQPSA